MKESEVEQAFLRHMQTIQQNDLDGYRQTVSDDLTMYEWWVTPHRIDGIPFHEFMMKANSERGTVFGATGDHPNETRFDYSNLVIQEFGETAIVSYTLLISSSTRDGVVVTSHNESRVLVKIGNSWKVVHVHKSPSWAAPHTPPAL